jgi:hypothetical protein
MIQLGLRLLQMTTALFRVTREVDTAHTHTNNWAGTLYFEMGRCVCCCHPAAAPTFRYIIGNNNETQRKQSAARQPESARRFSNLSSQRGRRVYSFTIGWAPIPISFPDSTYGLNNTGTDTHTHTHTQSIDQYNLCPREKQKRKKKKKIKVFFFQHFKGKATYAIELGDMVLYKKPYSPKPAAAAARYKSNARRHLERKGRVW